MFVVWQDGKTITLFGGAEVEEGRELQRVDIWGEAVPGEYSYRIYVEKEPGNYHRMAQYATAEQGDDVMRQLVAALESGENVFRFPPEQDDAPIRKG